MFKYKNKLKEEIWTLNKKLEREIDERDRLERQFKQSQETLEKLERISDRSKTGKITAFPIYEHKIYSCGIVGFYIYKDNKEYRIDGLNMNCEIITSIKQSEDDENIIFIETVYEYGKILCGDNLHKKEYLYTVDLKNNSFVESTKKDSKEKK